jgi:hypothetical protein
MLRRSSTAPEYRDHVNVAQSRSTRPPPERREYAGANGAAPHDVNKTSRYRLWGGHAFLSGGTRGTRRMENRRDVKRERESIPG